MGNTKLLQRVIFMLIALSLTSSLFALDVPNLPYRDREADKKRFNVEDIVYAEEIILNQCNVAPSIQIANRIKNGALVYPFLPILPEEDENKLGKNIEENLVYTKEYRDKLDEKYQAQISGRKVGVKFLPNPKYYDTSDSRDADEDYMEEYKEYQERLAKLIEEQKTDLDPFLSLTHNKIDNRDLFGTKVFDDNYYGILEQNFIVFYELFGWNIYINNLVLDHEMGIIEKDENKNHKYENYRYEFKNRFGINLKNVCNELNLITVMMYEFQTYRIIDIRDAHSFYKELEIIYSKKAETGKNVKRKDMETIDKKTKRIGEIE